MTRQLAVAILVLSIVGCSNSSSSSGTNAADSSAVSMKSPEAKKIGSTTLTEASEKAGIKAYPGSEKASGDVLDRGNGELKDEITFLTADKVEKVGAFYKDQGLDSKNGPVAGSAMGMTKGGASIIISFQAKGDRTEVVFKSVRAEKKAN